MQNNYKLHYFDVYGRGEYIRLLLNYAQVPFEDVRVTNWPKVKNTFPNGQIPCLEFADGRKMGQSISMLRYLGKTHGCYPTDEFQQYECDQICDNYADL